MKKRGRSEKELALGVVVSKPGTAEWKQRVFDAANALGAVVLKKLAEKKGTRVLYVGSYLNEFDDAALDMCAERGIEVCTLGFLEQLKNNPGMTMEEASLFPCRSLVDSASFQRFELVEGFERPFPQTVEEFIALERRQFGKDGTEIVLVDMMTSNKSKQLLERCLIWFSAFFHGAKVRLHRTALRQEKVEEGVEVDYLSLLEQLEALQTKKTMAVIGITDLPIVDSEAEATIYGRATGDGAGVISSFHFQEPGNRVFLSTAVHETCHVFGLDHCDYFKCVMNPECDAEEMDSASLLLCPICLAKLHYCMKFNVKERYDAMRIALQKLGLSQEAKAIADLRLLE